MTSREFNEKYKEYIETVTYVNKNGETITQSHYGLDIEIPSVVDYLDKVFTDLVKIPGFQYSQIKLKFNMARVYTNASSTMNFMIENNINKLVKEFDEQIIN